MLVICQRGAGDFLGSIKAFWVRPLRRRHAGYLVTQKVVLTTDLFWLRHPFEATGLQQYCKASKSTGTSRDFLGCRRVFWQGSTDHRGTPEAPGRTVTLHPDDSCITWGMAYQLSGTPEQQQETLKVPPPEPLPACFLTRLFRSPSTYFGSGDVLFLPLLPSLSPTLRPSLWATAGCNVSSSLLQ